MNPLVSVTITTKNEEKNIENCLKSILEQSYKNIEIIVVDNNSTDKTKEIALKYTDKVFEKGPERSAQRNYGMIDKSSGEFVMFVDADMILSSNLIENCVNFIDDNKSDALWIPEIVMGDKFFSKCRRFERTFYNGTVIDGARFFKKEKFVEVGGFDTTMSGSEDWDLDKKIKRKNIRLLDVKDSVIYHNEAEFNLKKYLSKKGYYAKSFDGYISKWGKNDEDIKKQFGLWYRYFGVFLENGKWKKLLFHPILTMGMYFLRGLVGVSFLIYKKNMKKEKIDIFIITHNSLLDGPINYYENYLLRNNRDVILLSHPLDNYKNRKTVLYKNKNEIYSKERKELGLINLFLDYLISFKISFKYNINIFIGANNFDTFFGILLKKIQKKPNKIVYFASDFSEERFSNKILNKIYFSIEKFVLKNADIVISNTKRSENKRIEFGLKNEKSILISNGVFLKNMSFKQKNINKKNFLFIGSVTKEHGLYDLLNTIHPIINQLTLIGSGDDWQRVLDLCKKKNINLEFHYKKDHDFTINYLQKFSGIGLAPYNLESKWTYYCSPLKVNEYIACGVPVLMSDVPEIANTISVEKLGITYNDLNLDIINNKLIDFNISDYNLKAEKFYKIYNYDSLYKKINI